MVAPITGVMIKFLADACLNHSIVDGCKRREPAIDFLSAHEARLEGMDDPQVLATAAVSGRILVSSDFATIPGHFGDFVSVCGESPGVLLVSQKAPLREVIEEILLIWAVSDRSEWINRIVEIPL